MMMPMCAKTLKENPLTLGREESVRVLFLIAVSKRGTNSITSKCLTKR